MQRVAVLTLALLFGLAAVAQADPVITLGTYTINAGTGSTAIPIFVYDDTSSGPLTTPGGHGVQGLNLNVTIGLGDNLLGPKFILGTPGQGIGTNTGYVGPASGAGTGADVLTGTIYAATVHSTPSDGGASSSQNVTVSIAVNPGVATMSTTPGVSLLATLYVSTVGVPAGTKWALKIGGLNETPGVIGADGTDTFNGPTDFSDGGNLNTVVTDGVISVVPEPASIVMALFAVAGLGAVAIRRARRA